MELRTWSQKSHAKAWQAVKGCRQSKMFIAHLGRARVGQLQCSKLRMAVGLMTGHIVLNRYLYNMGRVTGPGCPYCGELETAWHFIADSAAYEALRFEELGKSRLTEPLDNGIDVIKMIRFAQRTGRFD